jgi:type VI secretion system protein VasD
MKLSRVILFCFSLYLVACASDLKVNLNAARQLNQSEQNQSLPLVVVVYQLRDIETFQQATFQELWQQDTATLGDSMLSRREVIVAPGSKKEIFISRQKDAKFIGVIGLFRNPSGNQWRSFKKLGIKAPLLKKHFTITVRNNHVGLN